MSNPVLTRATDNPIFSIGETVDHSEVKYLPKVDHTPAEMDEASRLLLKAADLIEKHGWHRGGAFAYFSAHSTPPMCMFGAIYTVEKASPEARAQAERRMNEACGVDFMASWNDAPGRTKDEVVAKLRAAALGL